MKIKKFEDFINENYSDDLMSVSTDEMIEMILDSIENENGGKLLFSTERLGRGINGKHILNNLVNNHEDVINTESIVWFDTMNGRMVTPEGNIDYYSNNNLKNEISNYINNDNVKLIVFDYEPNIFKEFMNATLTIENKTCVIFIENDDLDRLPNGLFNKRGFATYSVYSGSNWKSFRN